LNQGGRTGSGGRESKENVERPFLKERGGKCTEWRRRKRQWKRVEACAEGDKKVHPRKGGRGPTGPGVGTRKMTGEKKGPLAVLTGRLHGAGTKKEGETWD